MPAQRSPIHAEFEPLATTYDEQVQRLARASALLARGAARRQQAQAAQSKVEINEEFIHNPPLEPRGTFIP